MGDSLLVSDEGEGQTFFGFVKHLLICLWVRYMVHNQYMFEVADEEI